MSFVTVIFTYMVAFPIGIYSAVYRYSILDYIFTFVGFHLAAPPYELSTAAIGSLFITYLAGVVTTSLVGRGVAWLGRPRMVLFALLGCMVISNHLAFFSEAMGHAALTGIAIGAVARKPSSSCPVIALRTVR